jgi:putrescine:ornithine antiporter
VSTAWALGALDRVRASNKLTIGYLADARPFSYTDASGKPAGYAVTVCSKIGKAVRSAIKQPTLSVDIVPVAFDQRYQAVERGSIDILCGAEPTLEHRAVVDFSIPILLHGTGVVIRSDAPALLKQLLSGQEPKSHPIWRGSAHQAPERRTVAVIGGTALEKALLDRLRASHMIVDVVPVKQNSAGIQMVLSRKADAFFSDRALLLDAVQRHPSGSQLLVLDRIFQRDQIALATQRDDGQLRLIIDRTLSGLMRSGEMTAIYAANFGAPDRNTLEMFEFVALPN